MPIFAAGLGTMLGDLGELIAGSSLLGKIVLLILFFMSVVSWALMVMRFVRAITESDSDPASALAADIISLTRSGLPRVAPRTSAASRSASASSALPIPRP